jgi:Tol biopolymer transport system component
MSIRDRKWGLYRKPSNNSGTEERLLESNRPTVPYAWAPGGQGIVVGVSNEKTGQDLSLVPFTGDHQPVPLVRSAFTDMHGQVSPNGKWLAYWSLETGRAEVYVQPFPSGPGKWPISTNGGQSPRWRADGREIFYLSVIAGGAGGRMVAVDVNDSGSTLKVGAAKDLFDTGYVNLPAGHPYHPYAVSPDGQRFLIPRASGGDLANIATPIVVVLNWQAGLQK